MTSPLSRAWATLTRYPLLALIPVLWEAAMFLLSLVLRGGAPYPGSRAGMHTVSVKFLLPQSLPSGAELIGQASGIQLPYMGAESLLPVLIPTVLGAFVTAGYLHLLNRALMGEAPSWERFTEGAGRFGARVLLWNLIMLGVLFLAVLTGPVLALILMLLLALVYFLVPYLIITRDTPLKETLTIAPGALRDHLSALLPVCVASLALSVVCSFLLTATGLGTLLLASPIWGWFGTWVTLGVLAVLQPQDQNA